MAAPTAQRPRYRAALTLIFLIVLLIFTQLTADHRHRDGDHQKTTGNTERFQGNTEDLQDPRPRNNATHKIIATDTVAVRLVLLRSTSLW